VLPVLFFGIASGILGATIGSAFQALTGARLAAIIGGVPLAIIGSLALGWYGFLFGCVNWLRFGEKGPRPRSGRGNQWLAHLEYVRGSGLCWL
jgi:hypothetical protein